MEKIDNEELSLYEYFNQKKEEGKIDTLKDNENGTIKVGVDGYTITINVEKLTITNIEITNDIEFLYELTSYENNKFKILIKIIDKTNGIDTIKFPDGDIQQCNGKEEVGIDYEVNEGVDYIFIAKNSNGTERREVVNFTKPKKPIIPEVSGGYLTLTLNGAESSEIEIEYDEREEFLNYYSLDNGETWKLYTGSIKATSSNIKAKSVHKKCKDIFEEAEKQIVHPIDAITWNSFDNNIDTYDLFSVHTSSAGYAAFKDGHYCLFNVDSSMWEEYISITYYLQDSNNGYKLGVQFYDKDGNEISNIQGPMAGGHVLRTDNFEIPKGTSKVRLYSAYYERPIVVQEITAYTLGNKDADYETYIDNHMEVDKKIYISSKYGNDTTGDGTQNNPYCTLNKISEPGIIENDYSYAIVLMNGRYELTTRIFELNCNEKINIIGNKGRTILEANNIYANHAGGSGAYEVNIYRLIWTTGGPATNAISVYTKMSLYNVVFNLGSEASYSYFMSSNKYVIYNCTLPNVYGAFLRTTQGTIQLTNCYGGFTSGYGTGDASWNYQTNYITGTPQVDSRTYRITDEESIWKNTGTGTNLDGSQANLGVYGGEYSWEE